MSLRSCDGLAASAYWPSNDKETIELESRLLGFYLNGTYCLEYYQIKSKYLVNHILICVKVSHVEIWSVFLYLNNKLS